MNRTALVIPNLNGKDKIGGCLDSLLGQTKKIIVVENGSSDGSLAYLQKHYPDVELVVNEYNHGFAGGVNQGIQRAIDQGYDYVALFNNDAEADKDWLRHLEDCLDKNPGVGIATCKFLKLDGKHIDSTGDMYSNWGIPFPRGRGEETSAKYDRQTDILSGTGGASIYRVAMLKRVGLFDEDFFAYFEDVDIGFRAQLLGWKAKYVPEAVAYHQIGATSSKMKGFNTYHSLKNYWLLFYKNVPDKYFWRVGVRLLIVWWLFFLGNIVRRRNISASFRGAARAIVLVTKKRSERRRIQSTKTVSDEYIWSLITHDLPTNAYELRRLRRLYWKMTGRKDG